MTHHDGSALPAGAEFATSPDARIGPVRSAATNVDGAGVHVAAEARLRGARAATMGGLAGAFALGFATILAFKLAGPGEPLVVMGSIIGSAIVGALIGGRFSGGRVSAVERKRRECSYVGEHGVQHVVDGVSTVVELAGVTFSAVSREERFRAVVTHIETLTWSREAGPPVVLELRWQPHAAKSAGLDRDRQELAARCAEAARDILRPVRL